MARLDEMESPRKSTASVPKFSNGTLDVQRVHSADMERPPKINAGLPTHSNDTIIAPVVELERPPQINDDLPTHSNTTLVERSPSIPKTTNFSAQDPEKAIPADIQNTLPNKEPSTPPPPPPNGGFKAWFQVVGSFCLYFCTWGLVSSYGSFQAIYETGPLKHHTSFEISIIGSLQIFLMVFLGLVAGPIYDAGYFRHLLALGSLLVVTGTLLQSFCVEFWQYILTQGVLVGVGAGCLSLLSVAVPSLWFTTRLPLANGFAAAGSGLGGVVLPIMVRQVDASAGLGWAARSMSFIMLALLLLANLVLKIPAASAGKRKPRSLVDPVAFKDTPYILFVLGCFTVFLGLYTPFVHIQSYTLKNKIASPRIALYMLAILNGSSIFGRIVPILMAQRVGPMNMIIGTAFALSITAFCLVTATDVARLIIAIIAYGFFTGTFFALQPTIFIKLSSDPSKIGTRFGMAFSIMSFALLFGPPLSGALLGGLGYNAAWIWAGVVVLLGGCLILASRLCILHPCEDCGLLVSQVAKRSHMHQHANDIHRDNKCYVCSFEGCEKQFAQLSNLKTHQNDIHKTRQSKCEGCGICSAEAGHHQIHNELHRGIEGYVCTLDNCTKSLSRLGNLEINCHKDALADAQKYDMKYYYALAGGNHEHAHPDPLLLDHCNAQFLQRVNLMTHQINCLEDALADTHDDQPFVCNLCHKKFDQRMDLKTHRIKLHSDAPKFEDLIEGRNMRHSI